MRIINVFLLALIVLCQGFLATVYCQEQPSYCLLFAPQYQSDPCPCYQFYLASTLSDAPRAMIAGGQCQVTDIAMREGWEVAYYYPLIFSEGDKLVGELSPYFGDALGCNDCRSGSYTPSDGPVSTSYDPTSQPYNPNYGDPASQNYDRGSDYP